MKVRLLEHWRHYPKGVVLDLTPRDVELLVSVGAGVRIDKPKAKEVKAAPKDKQVKGATTKVMKKTVRRKHGS